MSNLSSAALDLYDRGFIPVPQNKDKTTAIAWGKFVHERPKRLQIERLFEASNDNVAIIASKESGVCILDIDDPSKFPEKMPVTPTVKTSRGYHLYFKYPEDVEIRNTNLPYGDFFADKHLATVPPSVHATGVNYEWVYDLDTKLADIPDWLLSEVRQKTRLENGMPVPIDWDANQETTAYGAKALESELETLRNTREGGRNNQYNKSLTKIGSLIAGGQVNISETLDRFHRTGLEIGLSEAEMRGTDKSALSKSLSSPRMPKADNDNTPAGDFILTRYSDIEEENVDWIWPDVLAKGSLTIFAGEGGVGKSTITASIAATISKGGKWPVSGSTSEKGKVLLLTIEDLKGSSIKKRLKASGADMDNVLDFVIKDRPFSLTSDIPSLRKAVEQLGDVKAIVIDPITAHLGSANNDKVGDVRGITTALSALAADYMVPVLMVMHLNKGDRSNVIEKLSGSGAWAHAARNVYFVGKPDHDPNAFVMVLTKTNITSMPKAFEGKIKSATDGGSYVEWNDTASTVSPEKLLQKKSAVKFELAKDLIDDHLGSGGKITTKMLETLAADLGIGQRTLDEARKSKGVKAKQEGGEWYLTIPGKQDFPF